MPKQTFFKLIKEKQEHIINAAISEFSNLSFNEVKISDIVNKAKIPRSSFYDYFEDKTDLYRYIILIIKEEKTKFIAESFEKYEEGFFEEFREFFKAGAKFAFMKPEYYKIGNKMYENIEIVKDILGIDVEEFDASKVFEPMIKIGIESGELRSDIDVKFITKAIYILSSNFIAKGFEEEEGMTDKYIEEVTDKILEFIRYGIASSKK